MPNLFSLRGKTILVTGAAGIIGKEICDAFSEFGARLVITDLAEESLLRNQAADLAHKYPTAPSPLAISADLTDDRAVEELFRRLGAATNQQLDVLVNLAAIDAKFDDSVGKLEPSRFENFPLAAWERAVAVNATGLIRVTQSAVRMMLPRKRGNVVNVASTYGIVSPNQGLYRYPGETMQRYKPVDYVGTKSMLPNFTRYLATLYAREGLRANCIAPHGVENNHPEDFTRNFSELSPIGRMCRRDELRGPFVFLASDASSYVTGATLLVDGGWTAW